ncbi:polyprenol monophosphomannose synthase [bacterium]|nr:polyprenol monophosphomannose synthase [candidate division CSSED10-310 bacterium]
MKPLIIVPTYNEKDNIGILLKRVMAHSERFSVLIIDDSSEDGTLDVVNEWRRVHPDRIHVIQRPAKLGLGSAYIRGFRFVLETGYDPVFQMDADLSHDPDVLPVFMNAIRGADMVVGSRYLNGVSVVNWPLWRLLLSHFANRYARFVTGVRLTDITTGYTCLRRHVLEHVSLDTMRSEGYSFQIELKFLVQKKGYTIREIPIIFVDRQRGQSKLNRNIITEALGLVIRLRLGLRS